jgi:alpha-N-acetylglucosaminidase
MHIIYENISCKMLKICLALLVCVLATYCDGTSADSLTKPHASRANAVGTDPIAAVQGLVSRVLGPQYIAAFTFQVLPPDPSGNDAFQIGSKQGTVFIQGTTGVAMASGVHWYLKYWCNASIAWGLRGSGNQFQTVPAPASLPQPVGTTKVVSPVKYRYYMNVCTLGYSMVWWNMTRWQEEIDRMALWGINLPLGFVGQEIVWLKFYEQVGLNYSDLAANWMSGPAFLPWFRMGNVQRWGGPLDDYWINSQATLQIQMLAAMRAFGMMPVLPGFAGHVPSALVSLFPNASFTQSADWNGFNATYGGTQLS